MKPEVKLGEYKGLKVDKIPVEVTPGDVDAEIQRERERNGRTVEVTDRSVAKDDMITLDFEGFVDGEAFKGGKGTDYPLTIGSGAFIPGFEEQLIGAEIDQDVEVNVKFPEDYHEKSLAGKDALFKCVVHTIKEKELPELDDEFASEVSEFETLAEYKADVRGKLEEKKAKEAKDAREAIQWTYFGYLAAIKCQNGAAMSIGRVSTFLDIYIERDLEKGILTESEAQEVVDHITMKFRMVKFARIKSYNELFSGDPVWATRGS